MTTSSQINRVVSAAVALLFVSLMAAQAEWKTGAALPDLSTFALEGTLPQLKGKVVLIDFWASWCGPCKASFPVLNRLQQDYGPKGLVVLGINQDTTAALMQRFLKDNTAGFPVIRDTAHKLVESATPPSMPTSYLVDQNGTIRYVHAGFHGAETGDQYKKEIETLLNEKRGNAP